MHVFRDPTVGPQFWSLQVPGHQREWLCEGLLECHLPAQLGDHDRRSANLLEWELADLPVPGMKIDLSWLLLDGIVWKLIVTWCDMLFHKASRYKPVGCACLFKLVLSVSFCFASSFGWKGCRKPTVFRQHFYCTLGIFGSNLIWVHWMKWQADGCKDAAAQSSARWVAAALTGSVWCGLVSLAEKVLVIHKFYMQGLFWGLQLHRDR